jgi:hypothetical protein
MASDPRHFSKEFQMLPIIPSNRRVSAIPVLTVVGVFIVSWAAFQDLSAWGSLSRERLQSIQVGALANSKCCTHPGYALCTYPCVAGWASCGTGVVTDSNCGTPAAACPFQPSYTCNTPDLTVYLDDVNGRCTTTGERSSCILPNGSAGTKCMWQYSRITYNWTDCHTGDSLCPSSMQPTPYCYAK